MLNVESITKTRMVRDVGDKSDIALFVGCNEK